MRSFRIVVSFDVLKYRKLQFLQRTVTLADRFFFFEIFEKTFTAGIVKRIASYYEVVVIIGPLQGLYAILFGDTVDWF